MFLATINKLKTALAADLTPLNLLDRRNAPGPLNSPLPASECASRKTIDAPSKAERDTKAVAPKRACHKTCYRGVTTKQFLNSKGFTLV
jgi:hypothetical protein